MGIASRYRQARERVCVFLRCPVECMERCTLDVHLSSKKLLRVSRCCFLPDRTHFLAARVCDRLFLPLRFHIDALSSRLAVAIAGGKLTSLLAPSLLLVHTTFPPFLTLACVLCLALLAAGFCALAAARCIAEKEGARREQQHGVLAALPSSLPPSQQLLRREPHAVRGYPRAVKCPPRRASLWRHVQPTRTSSSPALPLPGCLDLSPSPFSLAHTQPRNSYSQVPHSAALRAAAITALAGK